MHWWIKTSIRKLNSSISIFQIISANTDKIFISGGRLSTRSRQSQLLYTSLLLIITLRFTYNENKNCSTIKKFRNIMNMIVATLIISYPFKCQSCSHIETSQYNESYNNLVSFATLAYWWKPKHLLFSC